MDKTVWKELKEVEQVRDSLQLERNETIAKLRELCKTYGDNNWPNDLHMADIIEKHLEKYIDHLYLRSVSKEEEKSK